ncbi:MAG: M1 family aminopeptidase [Vicingaceae bacterium]
MKKVLLPLFLISFLVAHTQTSEICKIIEYEAKSAKLKPRNLKSAPQTAAYDVIFYSLDISVDPTFRYVKGSVSTHFVVSDSSLSDLVFDLSSSLTVDSVIYRDSSIGFNRLVSNTVSIQLPNAIFRGIIDSVKVFYQGIPRNISGVNPFTTAINSNRDTVLWTLSEPYGAQEWWPCKNSLTDKADSIEIIVSTPQRYRVASHGNLLAIDSLSGIARYHYKTSYPIVSYLVAIAVAKYNYFEEYLNVGTDSILMQYFLYRNNSFGASSSGMEEFMQFFDSLLGPYPYIKEKYGHADFTFGGGIEHQTMSFMGNNGGELKAHELIHQWFGNKVTCGSWKDLWLNEGFATYLTALTYEFDVVHSKNFYQAYLAGMQGACFNYPSGSVYRRDTSSVASLFNPLVYQKGGFALHMIRWTIKDSAFFAGMRNFLNDSSLAFGFAKTPQLQAHFESSSGQNLDEFFKDWVYGKGFPRMDSYWSQNGSQFELIINQNQSDTSVSYFDIELPYRLLGPNLDTIVVVNPSFSGEKFTLTINQTINSIELDPDNWVLNQNGIITNLKEESIESHIKIYPNPAKNSLSIEVPDQIQVEEVRIFDLTGSLVKESGSIKNINISNLQKGVYFIELKSVNEIYRKRLIKN